MLFQLFGVTWVMSQRVNELLVSQRGQLGNCNALKMWRLARLCFMWCLWRGRNAKSFEKCEAVMLELKKMVL